MDLAISTKNVIAINKETSSFCGLSITLNDGETVRECLERYVTFTAPAVYPNIELIISMPCGNEVRYKTLDDIPTVDTPCLCGNPNHWFVKIGVM